MLRGICGNSYRFRSRMSRIPSLIRTIQFLLLAAIAVVPLLVLDLFAYPFVTEKTLLFYVLVELAFVLWLVAAYARREYRPPAHPVLIAGGIFLALYTLAGIVGVSPELAFFSRISRMSGLVLLWHLAAFVVMVAAVMRDSAAWRRVFNTAIASGALVALVAHLVAWGVPLVSGDGSTIGNSSYAGTYLLFPFFFALAHLLTERGRMRLRYALAAALIVLSPILFSFSGLMRALSDPFSVLGVARAAGGSILIGLVAAALVYLSLTQSGVVRNASRISLGLLIAGVLAAATLAHIPGTPVRTSLEGENVGSRFIFWESARAGIAERPLLGWGPEGYFAVFDRHFDPALYTDEYAGGAEAHLDKPHHAYLETAVTGGLLSLAAYLALIAALMWALIAAHRRGTLPTAHLAAYSGLIMAYLIDRMFSFDTITSLMAFGVLLAYAVFLSRAESLDPYPRMPRRVSWMPLALAIALIAPLLYINVLAPLLQQRMLVTLMEQTAVQERAGEYERLLELSASGRMSTAVYVAEQMLRAVPPAVPELSDGERAYVYADIKSAREAIEHAYGYDSVRYRLVLALTKLALLEYALAPDEAARADLLARVAETDAHREALSPGNPANGWVIAQRQVFAGEPEAALATLRELEERLPDVVTTRELREAVEAYLRGESDIPVFRM